MASSLKGRNLGRWRLFPQHVVIERRGPVDLPDRIGRDFDDAAKQAVSLRSNDRMPEAFSGTSHCA